jgi:glycosyltransferase involved in cell wall biosynthesis
LRILHLHSTFDPGGKELRAAKLINAFGYTVSHTIVSARPGALGARAAIDPAIAVYYPDNFPALTGRPFPKRLRRIAEAMRGYDLILTYNWGAMDAVMAHTLFAQIFGLPPLIHHEDGFNEDEAGGLKRTRNWFRRIALGRSSGLVVPSTILERIAFEQWHQPQWRVHRIANGIDVRAYGVKPKRDALPRIIKHPGEMWLGTLAGLRAVKNLPRLVRAFSAMPEEWQLVILGEGPERAPAEALVRRLGLQEAVEFVGFQATLGALFARSDVFLLPSQSESFGLAALEAQSCGLPVVASQVGGLPEVITEGETGFLRPVGDVEGMAQAVLRLLGEPALLARMRQAARQSAVQRFAREPRIREYEACYLRLLATAPRDSGPP